MTYQDNDTLNAGQQNATAAQTNVKKSKNKDAMVAKILASAAAGMVAGVGATYAAGQIGAEPETEAAEAETPQAEGTQAQHSIVESTLEERVAELEAKERIRQQQEQARQQREMEEARQQQQARQQENERHEEKHDEKEEVKEEGDFFKTHDVKIDSVEEATLNDGTEVRIYSGTVDGHEAAFMGSTDGRIVAAMIDENDNGEVDETETIDLRSYNMTDQQLALHQVSEPVHEVNVVAVEHDVEMGGEVVDVALVTVDDERVMLVDTNQNGEVDLTIADDNHNGSIDDGEIRDVSDAHLVMPTEDDITGSVTTCMDDEGMNDYSNDADVEVYEV